MTARLERAIAKLRRLPADRQDEAADLLLSVVEDDSDTPRLTPQQIAEVERRLGEPPRYAPHDEVRAFFQQKAAE